MQIFLQILLALTVACFAGAVYWKYKGNKEEFLNPQEVIEKRRNPEAELKEAGTLLEDIRDLYNDYLDMVSKMKVTKMLDRLEEVQKSEMGKEAFSIIVSDYL